MRTRLSITLAALLVMTGISLLGSGPITGETTAAAEPLPAEYTVRSISAVLHDDARDKNLPVRVVFPVGADGPRPLIVFSHGLYGSGEKLDPLVGLWAAGGFVVALPTHADSLKLKRLGGTKGNRRTRALGHWRNRPMDISFVLDSIDQLEALDPALDDLIDRERIGVGGHSFGAMTSQLIGGADPIGRGTYADDRADAVLLISPQGTGKRFTAESFASLAGPAMTITGDNDTGIDGQPAQPWRRECFDNSPPGSHALVWINDAYHNFGGINGKVRKRGPMTGPANAEHVRIVQTATLAFWQHTVRDGSGDVAALHEKLGRLLAGKDVRVEHN